MLACAALLLGTVAVLFPGLLQGRVFFERDIHLDWYAQALSFRNAVASGAWPLWNPAVGFGQPMLGNPNQQIAYPPTWLLLILQPATYYTLYVIAHLVFLGLGVRKLARLLGADETSARGAAVLALASGPILSLATIWHHLAGAAWLPWTVCGALSCVRDPTLARAVPWGAALAFQLLAGSPEMAVLSAALSGAVTVAGLVQRRSARLVGAAALAALLAVCLAAVQLAATFDAVRDAGRNALPAGMRGFWSVHPATLVETVWPLGLDRLPLRDDLMRVAFGGREPFIRRLYVGLPAALLALAGLLLAPGAMRWALGAALAGLLTVAMGSHLPGFESLSSLPVLVVLRYPSKAMAGVGLVTALLAGVGLERWHRGTDDVAAWRVVALAGVLGGLVTAALAVALVAAPDAWAARWLDVSPQRIEGARADGVDLEPRVAAPGAAEFVRPVARRLGLAGVLAVALGMMAWQRSRDPRGARWATVAVVLAATDLVSANHGLHALAAPALFEPSPALREVRALQDAAANGSRTYAWDYFGGWRPEWGPAPRNRPVPASWAPSVARAAIMRSYPGPLVAGGGGVVGSFESDRLFLFPAPQHRLLDAFSAASPDEFLRLLQRAAVARTVSLHDGDLGPLPVIATAPAHVDLPVLIRAVPGALPRLRVCARWLVVPEDEVWARLPSAPADSVLLSSGTASAPDAPAVAGVVREVERRADRIVAEATVSVPSRVVFVDAWASGWQARVDGAPAGLLKADGAFMAVEVGAGQHVVELRYRPFVVGLGAIVSAAAIVLALGALMWPRRSPH